MRLYAPPQSEVPAPPAASQPSPGEATAPAPTTESGGSPRAEAPVEYPHRGVPYGASFSTPFGLGSVTHRPEGDRPSAEAYFPKWFVKLATPDPHPELDEITGLLAKPGRYFDPTDVWENPSLVDPRHRKSPYKVTEFKEPFLVTFRDGLIYSVVAGAEKRRTPSAKGSIVDGVRPTSIAREDEPRPTPPAKGASADAAQPSGDIPPNGDTRRAPSAKEALGAGAPPTARSLPRTPARNGQIINGVQAGIGAATGILEGQLQARDRLRRFAFFHNPADGTWHVKDISVSYKDGSVLPESQAKEILKGIFENYDRKPPTFGP